MVALSLIGCAIPLTNTVEVAAIQRPATLGQVFREFKIGQFSRNGTLDARFRHHLETAFHRRSLSSTGSAASLPAISGTVELTRARDTWDSRVQETPDWLAKSLDVEKKSTRKYTLVRQASVVARYAVTVNGSNFAANIVSRNFSQKAEGTDRQALREKMPAASEIEEAALMLAAYRIMEEVSVHYAKTAFRIQRGDDPRMAEGEQLFTEREWGEARRKFRGVAASSVNSQERAGGLYNQAITYEAEGRFSDAAEKYREAERLHSAALYRDAEARVRGRPPLWGAAAPASPERDLRSHVAMVTGAASGSGVVVCQRERSVYIATVDHVAIGDDVRVRRRVDVAFWNHPGSYSATEVRVSEEHPLAMLIVEAPETYRSNPVSWGGGRGLDPGEDLTAVGYWRDGDREHYVRKGSVTASSEKLLFEPEIDAGFSGGGVFDRDGHVVGLTDEIAGGVSRAVLIEYVRDFLRPFVPKECMNE